VRGLFVFAVAALFATSVLAEDKKTDTKPKPDRNANVFNYLKKIKLDDKQQEKLTAIKKECAPKLDALHARFDKVMTPERRKVAQEARKAAAADGKKGKELQAAVDAALKLSDDEKKELKEINQERSKLVKEIREKVSTILTDEQKEALKAKPKK
jgi:hypothetical protein